MVVKPEYSLLLCWILYLSPLASGLTLLGGFAPGVGLGDATSQKPFPVGPEAIRGVYGP